MEPIAIIGFSIKFPGEGDTPEGFWRMMKEKQCAMQEWPKDRMNLEAFSHRDSKGFVSGAHFMAEDCGVFDAAFFGVSGAEACAIDPQSRILLETAYRALENAGVPMERANGSRTAVFNGCMADDYRHIITGDPEYLPKHAATGATACMLANRLSWFFNLQGPSGTLDSACSSSLLALDLACLSLRNNESDMALVTGSNIILCVESVLSLMNMSFTSPDGRCFSFDGRANGYGRGEGVGVLVIKRLGDAIRDGNIIRAVIRSTGSNQDGYTPGLTQPSKESQVRLILDTYRKAGLDLSRTRFFEAHGTGTALGDLTEAEAIGSVFRTLRSAEEPLYVGAVKSNIGHLEGASGIAGIVKAVMVLEEGIIPPNANFEQISPTIDAEFFNIRVPTEITPWPTAGLRRASIANFGYGGSNSHAVLDDAYHYLKEHGLSAVHCTVAEPHMHRPDHFSPIIPRSIETIEVQNGEPVRLGGHATRESSSSLPSQLFVWSTEDVGGIERMVTAYARFFQHLALEESDENCFLEQLATTLALKRSQLKWRAFAIGTSLAALRGLEKEVSKPVRIGKSLGLGYIFTGQGAQYYRMGVDLLKYPVFRETMELCQEAFNTFGCGWSIFELLAGQDGSFDIDDPEYAQPLTTALQVSLVELLSSFGLEPRVVIGHSSAEIAAAYASGGLSLSSACRVSYFRGAYASRLRKSSTTGAMLAANLSESAAEPYVNRAKSELCTGNLCIACVNSPFNVTISGDSQLVDRLKSLLDEENIVSHQLRTGVAYHSPEMLRIVPEYEHVLKDLSGQPKRRSQVTMISSVTGKEIENLDVLSTADYWTANLISPVKFYAAMMTGLSQSNKPRRNKRLGAPTKTIVCDWLEIGPHSTLKRPFREILQSWSANNIVQPRYLAALERHSPAIRSLQYAAGMLYISGYSVALNQVNRSRQAASGYENIFVKLPQYPFNHSKRYWHERPARRNVRLRPQNKLEFLGVPAPESTSAESKWRKVFDATESPWLLDHAVNGRAIYAGTGMIVMAIEGAKQLADKGRTVAGYFLHDAMFQSPISISTLGTTETNLYMRPSRHTLDRASHSYDFQIYTEVGDRWQTNCRGQISIQYADPLAPDELRREREYFDRKWADAQRDCTLHVATERMYKGFEDNGLNYGPAFRVMDNIHWDGSSDAICDIKTLQWTPEQSQSPPGAYTIHPATLDGLGQLGLVALTRGGGKAVTSGFVATRVREAWMSCSVDSSRDSESLKAHAQTRLKGLRGTETSAFALDSSGQMKVWVTGMETTSMSSHGSQLRRIERRRLCYDLDWKPDLGCLSSEEVLSYCGTLDNEPDPVEFVRHLQHLPLHLQKYVAWLEGQIERADSAHGNNTGMPLDAQESTEDTAALEEHLMDLNPEGVIHITIGRNLGPIIEGTVDPLQILYENGLVANHYERVCRHLFQRNRVDRYIAALAHNNPRMRILEVGAGTGSMTSHLLQALSSNHDHVGQRTCNFLGYDYTDVSEAFFEQARERFSGFGPGIAFKTFDIEGDPHDQGFQSASYDLVIAVWVVHVAKDVSSALRNIRKLLKPGGKLLLLEIVKPDVPWGTFVFGTLPGWWMENEASRGRGPGASEKEWGKLLQVNGFNGVDLVFRDYETEECRWSSLMVATAGVAAEYGVGNKPARRIIFITHPESDLQAQLVRLVVDQARESQKLVSICSIYDVGTVSMNGNPFVVFLPEIEQPLLADLDERMFRALQRLLCKAKDVLWVTAASSDTLQSAQVHIVDGLAKVLCTENDSLSFITAHLDRHQTGPDIWARHILYIMRNRLAAAGKSNELDYREVDGTLCIGRVREAEGLNDSRFEQTQAPPRARSFKQDVPLTSVVTNTGLRDGNSTIFTEDLAAGAPLEPEQIEIEAKAVGANFRDVFVLLGKLNDGDSVGLECSGVVTRVGSACSAFQPGDRVCAVNLGCLQTHVRVHFQLAVKIPHNLSFAMAAALPVAGVTAYYSLVNVAHLSRGESILIHSGAGGTGQMAVQIALVLGAEVFVTVGAEEKRDLVKSLYHIPDDHILWSRDVSFQRHIMRLTDGRGVDVVLNSLAGDGLVASWECVAPYGRFVELGKSDLEANSKLPMFKFRRNVSFSAVAVDQILSERPKLIRESLEAVMAMVRAGKLTHATPLQDFSVSATEDAFRLLQSGKSVGKLVINLNPADLVQTSLRHTPSYSFPPDATYVVAGGLGGLGRSAARWMATMGAKNLILLSRSGPKSEAAQQLVRELTEQGVRINASRCDVTSSDALASVLQECSDWPPIRGCIQGTMVLQDSIFENHTFEEWNTTLRSKVQSTQNLHDQLPPDLDFFILLSSLAGVVGTVSQSNYAAGNTFQDAFAAYRHSIGQRATSFDLGYMVDVGIVAETERYASRAQQISDLGYIRETEFHALLELYCDPALHDDDTLPNSDRTGRVRGNAMPIITRNTGQVLVGLVTPAQMRANGIQPPEWLEERSIFQTLPQQPTSTDSSSPSDQSAAAATTTSDYHRAFMQADSASAAATVVMDGLTRRLSRALAVAVGEIDPQRSLVLQGVDSLLAVEIRLWISRSFSADVSALDISSAPTLEGSGRAGCGA